MKFGVQRSFHPLALLVAPNERFVRFGEGIRWKDKLRPLGFAQTQNIFATGRLLLE